MPFWGRTDVVPMLNGMQGAVLRIPLIDPYAAAMLPYDKTPGADLGGD